MPPEDNRFPSQTPAAPAYTPDAAPAYTPPPEQPSPAIPRRREEPTLDPSDRWEPDGGIDPLDIAQPENYPGMVDAKRRRLATRDYEARVAEVRQHNAQRDAMLRQQWELDQAAKERDERRKATNQRIREKYRTSRVSHVVDASTGLYVADRNADGSVRYVPKTGIEQVDPDTGDVYRDDITETGKKRIWVDDGAPVVQDKDRPWMIVRSDSKSAPNDLGHAADLVDSSDHRIARRAKEVMKDLGERLEASPGELFQSKHDELAIREMEFDKVREEKLGEVERWSAKKSNAESKEELRIAKDKLEAAEAEYNEWLASEGAVDPDSEYQLGAKDVDPKFWSRQRGAIDRREKQWGALVRKHGLDGALELWEDEDDGTPAMGDFIAEKRRELQLDRGAEKRRELSAKAKDNPEWAALEERGMELEARWEDEKAGIEEARQAVVEGLKPMAEQIGRLESSREVELVPLEAALEEAEDVLGLDAGGTMGHRMEEVGRRMLTADGGAARSAAEILGAVEGGFGRLRELDARIGGLVGDYNAGLEAAQGDLDGRIAALEEEFGGLQAELEGEFNRLAGEEFLVGVGRQGDELLESLPIDASVKPYVGEMSAVLEESKEELAGILSMPKSPERDALVEESLNRRSERLGQVDAKIDELRERRKVFMEAAVEAASQEVAAIDAEAEAAWDAGAQEFITSGGSKRPIASVSEQREEYRRRARKGGGLRRNWEKAVLDLSREHGFTEDEARAMASDVEKLEFGSGEVTGKVDPPNWKSLAKGLTGDGAAEAMPAVVLSSGRVETDPRLLFVPGAAEKAIADADASDAAKVAALDELGRRRGVEELAGPMFQAVMGAREDFRDFADDFPGYVEGEASKGDVIMGYAEANPGVWKSLSLQVIKNQTLIQPLAYMAMLGGMPFGASGLGRDAGEGARMELEGLREAQGALGGGGKFWGMTAGEWVEGGASVVPSLVTGGGAKALATMAKLGAGATKVATVGGTMAGAGVQSAGPTYFEASHALREEYVARDLGGRDARDMGKAEYDRIVRRAEREARREAFSTAVVSGGITALATGLIGPTKGVEAILHRPNGSALGFIGALRTAGKDVRKHITSPTFKKRFSTGLRNMGIHASYEAVEEFVDELANGYLEAEKYNKEMTNTQIWEGALTAGKLGLVLGAGMKAATNTANAAGESRWFSSVAELQTKDLKHSVEVLSRINAQFGEGSRAVARMAEVSDGALALGAQEMGDLAERLDDAQEAIYEAEEAIAAAGEDVGAEAERNLYQDLADKHAARTEIIESGGGRNAIIEEVVAGIDNLGPILEEQGVKTTEAQVVHAQRVLRAMAKLSNGARKKVTPTEWAAIGQTWDGKKAPDRVEFYDPETETYSTGARAKGFPVFTDEALEVANGLVPAIGKLAPSSRDERVAAIDRAAEVDGEWADEPDADAVGAEGAAEEEPEKPVEPGKFPDEKVRAAVVAGAVASGATEELAEEFADAFEYHTGGQLFEPNDALSLAAEAYTATDTRAKVLAAWKKAGKKAEKKAGKKAKKAGKKPGKKAEGAAEEKPAQKEAAKKKAAAKSKDPVALTDEALAEQAPMLSALGMGVEYVQDGLTDGVSRGGQQASAHHAFTVDRGAGGKLTLIINRDLLANYTGKSWTPAKTKSVLAATVDEEIKHAITFLALTDADMRQWYNTFKAAHPAAAETLIDAYYDGAAGDVDVANIGAELFRMVLQWREGGATTETEWMGFLLPAQADSVKAALGDFMASLEGGKATKGLLAKLADYIRGLLGRRGGDITEGWNSILRDMLARAENFEAAPAAETDEEFDARNEEHWQKQRDDFLKEDKEGRVSAEQVAKDAGEVLTQEEAQARKDEWKAEAARQNATGQNTGKVILSLFDSTGAWSQPYRDAGYTVHQVDIDIVSGGGWEMDIMDIDAQWLADSGLLDDQGIHGIIAACPCTTFTNAATRHHMLHQGSDSPHWKAVEKAGQPLTKDEVVKLFDLKKGKKTAPVGIEPDGDGTYPIDRLKVWAEERATNWLRKEMGDEAAKKYPNMRAYTVALVDHTLGIIDYALPDFWAIENPVGRIKSATDLPTEKLQFNPSNYGDPYTKLTQIFGNFNPNLPQANVEPTGGSYAHNLSGSTPEGKKARSDTFEGFAYSFFMANHKHTNPMRGDVDEAPGAEPEKPAKKKTAKKKTAKKKAAKPTQEKSAEEAELDDLLDGMALGGRTPTTAGSQWDVSPDQELASGSTSINKNLLPATAKRVEWEKGTSNVDIGGGRFDNFTEFLAGKGVKNFIFDPFNRSLAHNTKVAKQVAGGKMDTATVNNVLNVIKETKNRGTVIAQAADAIKPDGVAYFKIHEGSAEDIRKGKRAKGGDKWQEHRKTNTYIPEIEEFFEDVTQEGDIITARAPFKSMALGGRVPASQEEYTKDIPLEKAPAVMAAAQAMIRLGYTSPAKMAKRLDEKFTEGQIRPYSEGIWRIMTAVQNDLATAKPVDWVEVYNDIDAAGAAVDAGGDEQQTDTGDQEGGGGAPAGDGTPEGDTGDTGGGQGDVGRPGEGGADENLPGGAGGADVESQGGAAQDGEMGDERGGGQGDNGPADPVEHPGRGNYVLSDPEKVVGGGPKARFARNFEAIATYQELKAANREPTSEELDKIAAYMGWGAFGQELFKGSWSNPRPKEGWEKEDEMLRDHLDQKEWEAVQSSIINAHYTDPPTVGAVWDIVRALGFAGGRVLEPSMGIGNYFGLMPQDLADASALTGIELDKITAAMATTLYPESSIYQMGYQESKAADGFYDLVVGNWPFFEKGPADRRYDKIGATLHDYFFIKALDQVRPGGFVIGITSSGTMDKKGRRARAEMAKRGELVASFRLPSGAFKEYAGTSVVTDLVILKKRQEPLEDVSGERWLGLATVKTPNGDVEVNQYYKDNPKHILGTLNFGHGTTSGRPGMIVDRPRNLRDRLKKLPEMLPEGAKFDEYNRPKQDGYVTNNSTGRQGMAVEQDGELYVVEGDHLKPFEQAAKFTVKNKKTTAARRDQIGRLISLRNTLGQLLDAQRKNEPTEELRDQLGKEYSEFEDKHGDVNTSDGLKFLFKAKDPSVEMIAGLVDADGNRRAIFSKDILRGETVVANPSIGDALAMARNASASDIDIEELARMASVSVAEVEAELLGKQLFKTPTGLYEPADVYIAGNVRQKMREAEAAKAEGVEGMDPNIAALKAAIPDTIEYFDIEPKVGATWVTSSDYNDFVAHLLGFDPESQKVVVERVPRGWKVVTSDRGALRTEKAQTEWGTARVNWDRLFSNVMNLKITTVRTKDADGNDVVDTEATKEAAEKAEAIKEEFKNWVFSNPARTVRLEARYNDLFNSVAIPEWDGSHLTFEGMALEKGDKPFNLREHQANAIWRGLVTGRGIYAHEVGTGKTLVMAGLAMESRRLGLAKKPMLFAHNANSRAVSEEIQAAYPGAKVLYVDNLNPANRQKALNQIALDDWDVVVLPHSLTGKLTLRPESVEALLADQIFELETAAMEAAQENNETLTVEMMDEDDMKHIRNQTAKDMVKEREKLKIRIEKARQLSESPDAVFFDDMGVDMIMADEAHIFKNRPIATTQKMKGLNTKGSERAIMMELLTSHLKKQTGGRGVHLFTGTPVTNTINEIYNHMRYIMDDDMKRDGIDSWDAWFNTFADSDVDVEINAAGVWEPVERLTKFVNLPELRRTVGQYFDTVFADDMPEFKMRDSKEGRTEDAIGRPYKTVRNVITSMTPRQRMHKRDIGERYRSWQGATGMEKRRIINSGDPRSPIIIEGEGLKSALDYRLIDKDAPAEEDSKVQMMADNVMSHYEEHPKSTQMIFLQVGKSDKSLRSTGRRDSGGKPIKEYVETYNLVEGIKKDLISRGVKPDEIADFSKLNKKQRTEAANLMQQGKIRVAIGGTETMGTGVNAQNEMRAMHHLDAPWVPGDLEQRNGRGQRQGNKWNTVYEYRYITEASHDARRWQILLTKSRFIEKFMKADDNVRTIEGDGADLTSGSFEETFSDAAGDPRIMQREKLTRTVNRLMEQQRRHWISIETAKQGIERNERGIAGQLKKLPAYKADAEYYETVRHLPFEMTLKNNRYTKLKTVEEKLAAIEARVEKGAPPQIIGEYKGFQIEVHGAEYENAIGDAYMFRLDEDGEPMMKHYLSRLTKQRMDSMLRGIGDAAKAAENWIAKQREDNATLNKVAGAPFGKMDELETKQQQLASLLEDLDKNPQPPPPWLRTGAPIGSTIYIDGEDYGVVGYSTGDGFNLVIEDTDGNSRTVNYKGVRDENGDPVFADDVEDTAKEELIPIEAMMELREEAEKSEAPKLAAARARYDVAATNLAKTEAALEEADRTGGVAPKWAHHGNAKAALDKAAGDVLAAEAAAIEAGDVVALGARIPTTPQQALVSSLTLEPGESILVDDQLRVVVKSDKSGIKLGDGTMLPPGKALAVRPAPVDPVAEGSLVQLPDNKVGRVVAVEPLRVLIPGEGVAAPETVYPYGGSPLHSRKPMVEPTEANKALIDRVVGDVREQKLPPMQRINNWYQKNRGHYMRSIEWAIDSAAAVGQMERALDKEQNPEASKFGRLRKGADSASKSIRLTRNIASVMHFIVGDGRGAGGQIEYQDGWFRPIGFKLDKNGRLEKSKVAPKSLQDILAPILTTPEKTKAWEGYMHARRSLELWDQWYVDKKGNRSRKAKGYDSKEQIIELMEDLEQNGEFEEVAKEYAKFNKRLVDLLEDTGVISKGDRNSWESSFYVPFNRIMGEDGDQGIKGPHAKAGIEGQHKGLVVKQLKGSEKKVDIMVNIYQNAAAIIDVAFKNAAMRKVAALGIQTGTMKPEPHRKESLKVATDAVVSKLEAEGVDVGSLTEDELNTMITFWRQRPPEGDDIVSVSINGKSKYYRVSDKQLLHAIQDMRPKELGWHMKAMNAVKTFKTKSVTVNPAFVVSNFIRDTLANYVQSAHLDIKWEDLVRGAGESVRNGPTLELIQAVGGGSGTWNKLTEKNVRKHFSRIVENGEDAFHRSLANPFQIARLVGQVYRASENTNRVAAAISVLRKSGDFTEAGFEAMDLLDFAATPGWSIFRHLTMVSEFFNARIQGAYRLGRGAKADPREFAKRGLILAAATAAYAAMHRDNERYWQLDDWDRDLYWHFWIGKNHVRIPKPFEVGAAFSTSTERLLEQLWGNPDDGVKALGDAFMFAMLQTMEFDLRNILGAAGKPILELASNHDSFRDTDIIYEWERRRDLPSRERSAYTSFTTATLAEAIGDVTPRWMEGFNRWLRSPKQLDFLKNSYLNSYGRWFTDVGDSLARATDAAPQSPSRIVDQIPVFGEIARRFVPDDELRSTRYVGRAYENADRLSGIKSAIDDAVKNNRPEDARALVERHREMLGNSAQIRAGVREMRKISKAKTELLENKDINQADKRRQAKILMQKYNAAARTTRVIR